MVALELKFMEVSPDRDTKELYISLKRRVMLEVEGTDMVACPLLPSKRQDSIPTVPTVQSKVMLALLSSAQSVIMKFDTSFIVPTVGQSVKFTPNQSSAVFTESPSIEIATSASMVMLRIGSEYCVVMSAVQVSPVDFILAFSDDVQSMVVFCHPTSRSHNRSTVLVNT